MIQHRPLIATVPRTKDTAKAEDNSPAEKRKRKPKKRKLIYNTLTTR